MAIDMVLETPPFYSQSQGGYDMTTGPMGPCQKLQKMTQNDPKLLQNDPKGPKMTILRLPSASSQKPSSGNAC